MRRVARFKALPLLVAMTLHIAACGSAVDVQTVSIDAESPNSGRGTGTATLSWLPPTENTDGTPLVDLAGYRVYRGSSPYRLSLDQSIPNPGITTVVIDRLDSGTHYFAVTAYARSGSESVYSQIRSKTVP